MVYIETEKVYDEIVIIQILSIPQLIWKRKDSAMLFKKKWFEVYNSDNLEKIYKAKNLLFDNNITCRTDVVSSQLRLSGNIPFARGAALSRWGKGTDIYKLQVKEKDREKAKYLLSRL